MKLNAYIYGLFALVFTGCLDVDILDRIAKDANFFHAEDPAPDAI